MNDITLPHDAVSKRLPLLDQLCDEFESAWLRGSQPQIEEFVARIPESERAVLFRELLGLELDYRRDRRERPAAESYISRFPQWAETIQELCADDDTVLPGNLPTRKDDPSTRKDNLPTDGGDPLPGTGGAGWLVPGGRYRVVGEIARGGMGAVLLAIDNEIQRPMAIKVMLDDDDAGGMHRERFLAEARITGQLQHPGIPPVHEIGRLADGRPYFSMKRIEGRTLAALLRERPTPLTDLSRFLKVFEQVAQTIGYAHSRGIIHRDLKPHNMMVGEFGEVQVMDWGLARRLNEAGPQRDATPPLADAVRGATAEPASWNGPESAHSPPAHSPQQDKPTDVEGASAATLLEMPAAGSGVRIAAEGPVRLTHAGQVLGTPGYMPPEQARGEVDALDQRSDVFGLGAILCEVLTGQPPYRGTDRWEILHLARKGDLADALQRLEASGADAELTRIAARCLSVSPEGRPSDAGCLAEELGAYLESVEARLQQAHLERAQAQGKADEERKRRRLAVGLAAAVLVLVLGTSAAGLWYMRDRAQRGAAETARRSFLETEVSDAAGEAERLRQDLHKRLHDRRQAAQLQSDPEEWRALLQAAKSAWKRADRLAAGDRELLSAALKDRLASLESQLRAEEADRRLVFELDKVRLESSSLIREQVRIDLAAAKLAQFFRQAGFDVQGDKTDRVAARLRKSTVRLPLLAGLDFWALVEEDPKLRPRIFQVARLADPDPWRDRFRSEDVRADLQGLRLVADQADTARQSPQLLSALAQRLRLAGGARDAIELLRRSLVDHPRDFWLLYELGLASQDAEEQTGAFRAALAVRPTSAVAYYNLGVLHAGERHFDDAAACYRKAIELDPNFAAAQVNLGLVLEELKQPEEAIACYRRALQVDPRYILAHIDLGGALQAQHKLDDAIACYRKALEIDSQNAAAHNNLGAALREQGRLDDAIVSFRRALRINESHAMAWCNLGHALRQQSRFGEAQDAFRRGHELGSRQSGWTFPSAQWLVETERLLAAEHKLPAVLRGETSPADTDEQLVFAELCLLHKNLPAAATRFYADAFAVQPQLAEDRTATHRYNAACAAALAAAGQGQDVSQLDDEQQAGFRGQALVWLRAELIAWEGSLGMDPQVAAALLHALRHWQADPDLASVRDGDSLTALPAGEQQAWRQLWTDHATLLNQVQLQMAKRKE